MLRFSDVYAWMDLIHTLRVIAVSTFSCCCLLKASVAPHWVEAIELSVCVYERL